MTILSIETSCDETSLALTEAKGGLRKPEFNIKNLITASQIETHRPWGGVVPNLAKQEHQKNLPILFKKLKLSTDTDNLQLITVTVGPGLEPCLWQGIEFAKQIAKNFQLTTNNLVGANHLHGHMYSFLLPQKANSKFQIPNSKLFPAIQLLVSGGHTILIYMKSLTEFKKLGETRDDAAGEAFDKVARMLELPYPGGPEIEKLAANYRGLTSIEFPRPMISEKNYDFSFSGLKTAALYYLRNLQLTTYSLQLKQVVASSFQSAVIDVLVTKTLRATEEYKAKSVILSGGVAANKTLRKSLQLATRNSQLNFVSADTKFQGDNAAMIAVAGYITRLQKKKLPLKAKGRLDP